ncbi:RhuM family protein [Ruminococcus sp. HUN007]|uniref:RhuM family protein n=1 Tax=Ruminococcus sp. HUN007 TaxID=1514668 RepID=UPI0006794526
MTLIINNALKEELSSDNSTVAKFATVQTEGDREVKRDIEYYNLDVIISVGYRVKSQRGVEFRKWANKGAVKSDSLESISKKRIIDCDIVRIEKAVKKHEKKAVLVQKVA